jgi:anhydro-N-acetylmuramic acid kinase
MNPTKFIGCMTGTSCDGLDIAYIETNGEIISKFGASHTFKFENTFCKLLKTRINLNSPNYNLDTKISDQIAINHIECLRQFIRENNLKPDAIGMHGQTVYHHPKTQTSLQLGNAQMVASAFNIPVVAQFRQNDLANGGQGAPLVPIYHKALSNHMEHPIAFINIGGVANITFINGDELIAGDVGPGNALIDDHMLKLSGIPLDENGKTALLGTVQQNILQEWQQDKFFNKPLPKSLDRQHFHGFLKDITNLNIADGAATLSALTCFGIINALKKLPEFRKIIICGGGRHNRFIMQNLKNEFANVVGSETLGINPDALEAQMIAYLTARFFYKIPSSFLNTTGAKTPTIAGKIFKMT